MDSLKRLTLITLILLGMACTSEDASESSTDHANTSEITKTVYNNHGVSFSIPEGWKQFESEIPESGMYIMVEKQGEDESGQFVVSILNNKVPLNAYMEVMKDELVKSLAASGSTINFKTMNNHPMKKYLPWSVSFHTMEPEWNFRES